MSTSYRLLRRGGDMHFALHCIAESGGRDGNFLDETEMVKQTPSLWRRTSQTLMDKGWLVEKDGKFSVTPAGIAELEKTC